LSAADLKVRITRKGRRMRLASCLALLTVCFAQQAFGQVEQLIPSPPKMAILASLSSPRFFTDYEGLSLLIATLHSAARASADNLVKSGAAAAFTMALRKIVVTHIQSFAVGISTNRTTVSMQIQTMEGPLSSFAADPQTARKLAEYLTEAADQLKSPSSLN